MFVDYNCPIRNKKKKLITVSTKGVMIFLRANPGFFEPLNKWKAGEKYFSDKKVPS